MDNAPSASIVICTHNPDELLREVLRALLDQNGIEHAEILVIDNASNPPVTVPADTSVRVIRENRLGLSHARNRGMAEAGADLILFLDDDAIPGQGWLDAFLQAASDHPEAGSFGGPVDPSYASPLPAWVTDAHLPYFGAFDRGAAPVRLAYPDLPRGCNMALRKSAVASKTPFNAAFGKRGRSQACYEEIDLCWRLERAGYPSLYVPGARVTHFMGSERFDARWFAERVFEQGKAVRTFERIHRVEKQRRMMRHPFRGLFAQDRMKRQLARGYLWGSVVPMGKPGGA